MMNIKSLSTIMLIVATTNGIAQNKSTTTTKVSSNNTCDDLKKENESLRKALDINTPISEITSDDIDFKIVKIIGDKRTQMITITTIATNHKENRAIEVNIQNMKIVSLEGDVLKLNSFMVAGNNNNLNAFLNTDVPIKCTFTFGPLLPTNEIIKLFNYPYIILKPGEVIGFGSALNTNSNEFKDLKIEWK